MKFHFTKIGETYPITNIVTDVPCTVTDMNNFTYNGIGLDYICTSDGDYTVVGDVAVVNGETILTIKMF